MKKVGIITIHNDPNYGASIQAFSLYKYIELQGYDCEVIDLHRRVHDNYVPPKGFKLQWMSYWSYKHRIKFAVMKLMKRKTEKKIYYSPGAKVKFEEFNALIKMSHAYVSINELYANPPEYDLYITGSDQVWNPMQEYCIEPYFLTFVRDGKPKISYAASIGINELTSKEKSDFKHWLASYSAISVREKQAKKLLESFTHYNVECVLDPTFLLDFEYWKSIATNPPLSSPYILLFSLYYNPELLSFALRLSKECGLKLVYLEQIQPDAEDDEYVPVKDAGPKEFLGYIQKAEMVITTSFHCTVFSIILGAKNFCTYIASNKRRSRITDLLDMCHLSDHVLSGNLEESYSQLESRVISRSQVTEILKKEQDKSRAFLNKYLSYAE